MHAFSIFKIHRKVRYIYIVSLILIFIFQCCCENQPKDYFVLTGTVTNSTNYLIIADENEQDTILIDDGRFFYRGKVNGAIMKSLFIGSSYTENPNFTSVFLEPGEIKIKLVEDRFKEAVITGSKVQKEKEKVDKLLEPLTSRYDSFMKKRESLLEEMRTGSPKASENWKKLVQEWDKTSNEIRRKNLQYANENKSSYLSSLFLYSYIKFIPKDSAQTIYQRFEPKIKKGYYGLKIADILGERESSEIGDLAPLFNVKDLKGNPIILGEIINGKHVLLQFWASWCEPCRKSNPYLIELYKEHSKKIEILGLSVDKNKDKWKQAIEKDEIGLWPHIDAIVTGIDVQYNVLSIPNYLLIDSNGVIVYRGQIEGLEEKLESIE